MPPQDDGDSEQLGKEQHRIAPHIDTGGGDVVGRDKVMGDVINGDKVMGDKISITQKITHFFMGDSEQQHALRNRNNMLQLVWNTWIEGVLKRSLYNEMLIELGMETKPDAVEHPWNMVMQMPDREPRTVSRGTTMLELFDHAIGSLLILGEPGSGKTTMLLELARLSIERVQANPTQPIPVVFNLSSWTPKVTIADWLVDELRGKYYVSPKIGRSWIENDELLLLLDGLDEVETENREACVQAINAFRENHSVQLAICSRKQEYEALTLPLKLCGAVLIQPLTDQQVDEYLLSAGNGLVAVHQLVNHDPVLREFTQTPLILSILVLTYQSAPPENIKALETESDYRNRLFDDYIAQMFRRRGINPRYTLEQSIRWLVWLARSMTDHGQSLFSIEDIQLDRLSFSNIKLRMVYGLAYGLIYGLVGGLIGGLISGPIGCLSGGLSGMLIGGMVVGLIGVREQHVISTKKPGFSWQTLLKGLIFGLIIGLIVTPLVVLIVGLISRLFIEPIQGLTSEPFVEPFQVLISGLLVCGPIVGLIVGLLVGLIGPGELHVKPTEKLSFSWQGFLKGLTFGLIFGLIGGLISGLIFGFTSDLISGLIIGLIFWLFLALAFGLIGGLSGSTTENRNIPGAGIKASLKNLFYVGLGVGMGFGLIGGLIGWLVEVLYVGLIPGLIFGLIGGLFVGLKYGGVFLINHALSRFFLYRAGHIPWNLIAFLDYCTDRIFLRRVGGGYIFIHRMLMEHFAAMDEEKS